MGGFTRTLLAITVLFQVVLLAGGIALTLPLGLGPDEPPHLQYAGFLAERGALPDPEREDVLQAQHPPAWHAVMGALYGELGPGAPIVLPYERRVVLSPGTVVPDPIAASVREARGRAAPGGPLPTLQVGVLYALRLAGVVFGLVTAVLVLGSAGSLFPDRRNVACLAAATGLLVPGFVSVFATPNNDQFAILFGTAGFAALVAAARRGRAHAPAWVLFASVLYGIGFLSKLLVAGAFVAGLVLVLFWERKDLATRLRTFLILIAGPAILAGGWVLMQALKTGSPHGLATAAAHHPELLRVVSPDIPFGLLDLLGELFGSYLSSLGRDQLDPGRLWSALAAGIPLLVLGAALVAALGRHVGRRERVLGWAFLAGLFIQCLVLIYGNLDFVHTHGRYLQSLVLPGTLALAAGARPLFGRRAAVAVGAAAVIAALGGILLLHGRVLPTYHAGHAIQQVPWTVAYVDVGAQSSRAVVEDGIFSYEHNWYYPRPVGRFALVRDLDRPVRIGFDDLDPEGLYLLSVHLHPPGPGNHLGSVSTVDVLADGALVSGPLSLLALRDWATFPVPRSATLDGSFRALVRLQTGETGGVSEVLLRRLPLTFDERIVTDDTVRVRFRREGTDRLPVLTADLQARGVPLSGRQALMETAPGVLEATLPLPPPGSGPLELRLTLPAGLWADAKLAPYATDFSRHLASTLESPGLFVLDLDDQEDRDAVVAHVPVAEFPAGDYVFTLVDSAGLDVTGSFVLATPWGELAPDAAGFRVLVPGDADPAAWIDVVFRGDAPLRLDRLRAHAAPPWIFDLHLAR